MEYTRLTNLEVTGKAKLDNVEGGGLKVIALSKSDSYTLAGDELDNDLFLLANTGTSKVYTIPTGKKAFFLFNTGAKTFTVKASATDTGASAANGKVYLATVTDGAVSLALLNYSA